MLDIIRLLPESLANQIAAGEVVQRPASAVKEMLENSVDACATSIELILEEAGKTLIQVVDDGKGMSETDARMCFERHATSKIKTADDLYNIHTFGFRGEAMASIAAVAQIELKTRQEDQEIGTLVYIEGSEVKKHEPIATSKGTSIAVKNLFFNTPARRKFLKSNSIELRHITEEFERVALANPHINFAMYHNGQEIYNLKEGKLAKRIVAMFGKNYQSNLLTCQEDVDTIKLLGYVGKPDMARKTRGHQYFFVNNRFIKSSYLHHAVMTAYEGLLPKDAHPFYVLFIDIDPQKVDVNVHPTKTEIKFDDERTMYVVVQTAVKQALGVHHVATELDFDLNANFLNTESGTVKNETDTYFTDFSQLIQSKSNPKPKENRYQRPEPTEREKNNLRNWERIYNTQKDGFDEDVVSDEDINFDIQKNDFSQTSAEITFSSAANHLTKSELETELKNNPISDLRLEQLDKRLTFWVAGRYVASPTKSGMMLIDASAAHERILYERYQQRTQKAVNSQQLLFPPTLSLSPADVALVKEIIHDLQALGFLIEFEGPNQLLLLGLPTDLLKEKGEAILEAILEQYKHNQSTLKIPKRENILRAFAKRAAMQNKAIFSEEEMRNLIDELFACQQPYYTPDGKKTFVLLDSQHLENFFFI